MCLFLVEVSQLTNDPLKSRTGNVLGDIGIQGYFDIIGQHLLNHPVGALAAIGPQSLFGVDALLDLPSLDELPTHQKHWDSLLFVPGHWIGGAY